MTDEKRREYHREYYERNKERILEYRKNWRAANREKVVATQAKYFKKKLEELTDQENS